MLNKPEPKDQVAHAVASALTEKSGLQPEELTVNQQIHRQCDCEAADGIDAVGTQPISEPRVLPLHYHARRVGHFVHSGAAAERDSMRTDRKAGRS